MRELWHLKGNTYIPAQTLGNREKKNHAPEDILQTRRNDKDATFSSQLD